MFFRSIIALGFLAALLGAPAASAAAVDARLPPPHLRPSPRWFTITTGPLDPAVAAPQTWAVNIRADLRQVGATHVFDGLRHLQPNAIVLWLTTSGRGGPNRTFRPASLPLRLGSFRVDRGWEGQPAPNVQQRLRWISVGDWRLDVRVYFGTQHPSRALLAEAQAELDRLMLPR